MGSKLNADEIDRLAAAATKAPWYALEELPECGEFESPPPAQHCISTYEDDTCDAVAWMGPGFSQSEEEDAANAALIAYLRNHAAEISEAIRENARLRELLVEANRLLFLAEIDDPADIAKLEEIEQEARRITALESNP